jgi:hypothetical protein
MNKQEGTNILDFSTEVKLKGFKVYQIDSKDNGGHKYNRKDFFKISLNTGKYIFHYADRSLKPMIPFCFLAIPGYHTPVMLFLQLMKAMLAFY